MGKISKRKPSVNREPLISIIIPTYNEEKVIKRLLKSIRNQTYKKTELIVVDDGSIDSTVRIAKKFVDRVFERKHAERSVQRNFGASKSKGKYLMFLDSDMELSKKVVADCVRLAERNDKIGAIVIPEESVASNFWEKVKAYERSFYNLEGDELTDAARFFLKNVFNKVEGYDETITGPEDWDLPERVKKLGYKIERIKSKILHYERVSSLISLAKKKYYYALKSHRYLSKHEISLVSPKTIYFLRPVFYKNWKKLVSHPILTLSMFFMFTVELFGGGMGFIVGRIKKI